LLKLSKVCQNFERLY